MLDHLEITTLRNGVIVLTSANPEAESVSMGLYVMSGGRHEPAKRSGVSHFLEHMLFKGTPSRSALKISQAIEGRGGYLNAFTQEEGTCFYARVPYEFMPSAVDVLTDMYCNATMPDDEFQRERQVILEEIKMYADQPQQVVEENFQDALFSHHAVGRPLIGTPATLQAMTRQTLLDYKTRAYVGATTIFAFSGRITPDACVACVERTLNALPRGKKLPFAAMPATQPQQHFILSKKDVTQVQAILGFRIFGWNDPRRYALHVLNGVLGGNMSSRLFQQVREKHGLCYSISSSSQLFSDTGMWQISAGFDTARAQAALRMTIRELKRICDTKLGAAELKRTKDYLLGTYRLGLESMNVQMSHLINSYQAYGRVISPEETIANLRAVSAEDVQTLATQILTSSHQTLSLVVPNDSQIPDMTWQKTVEGL